jgi:hypothetical protein
LDFVSVHAKKSSQKRLFLPQRAQPQLCGKFCIQLFSQLCSATTALQCTAHFSKIGEARSKKSTSSQKRKTVLKAAKVYDSSSKSGKQKRKKLSQPGTPAAIFKNATLSSLVRDCTNEKCQ